MFAFKRAQEIVSIGNVRLGGQPGDNPPVLIASIFYHGHKIVRDENEGLFDREVAEGLIKSLEELSDKTKLPFMLDVVGGSSTAIVRYIEFVCNVTKAPILVDPLGSISVAKAALSYVSEVGLSDKVVYNSLTAKSKEEEYQLLKEFKVSAAVALLYTDRIVDVDARIKSLELILKRCSAVNVDKVLVDTFVIDVPSLAAAMRTIIEVKSRYGLPSGCGAHNAVSTQRRSFKERFGAEGLRACELTANISPLLLTADFVLFGPIEMAREIFPAAYVVYNSYRYLLRRRENAIAL